MRNLGAEAEVAGTAGFGGGRWRTAAGMGRFIGGVVPTTSASSVRTGWTTYRSLASHAARSAYDHAKPRARPDLCTLPQRYLASGRSWRGFLRIFGILPMAGLVSAPSGRFDRNP